MECGRGRNFEKDRKNIVELFPFQNTNQASRMTANAAPFVPAMTDGQRNNSSSTPISSSSDEDEDSTKNKSNEFENNNSNNATDYMSQKSSDERLLALTNDTAYQVCVCKRLPNWCTAFFILKTIFSSRLSSATVSESTADLLQDGETGRPRRRDAKCSWERCPGTVTRTSWCRFSQRYVIHRSSSC